MLKIFLSSHGTLASGIKKSVEILVGESDKLVTFDAYVNDEQLKDAIEAFFKETNEEDDKVLLSDLYGGSVNQKMYLYLNRPNTYLIAGVNLALVLDLLMQENVNEMYLNELVEKSRMMLRVVRYDIDIETDDTDFL